MLQKKFKLFIEFFSKSNVIVYFLIGIAIIFLTFLTDNNAIEIAISAVASVFIGIAVNNLSAHEAAHKITLNVQNKINLSVKMLSILQEKLNRLHADIEISSKENISKDFEELKAFMKISVDLLQEK